MMMAMVADIAIKAVTQNNFMVPPDALAAEDEPLPRVLAHTPGVVLIDELDVHLHPRWQRDVARHLKMTFPKIQFVCTSHSPQVIGEIPPEEIRLLEDNGAQSPGQSFGMDSNWILRVLMGAEDQNADVKSELDHIFKLITERRIDEAASNVAALRARVGNSESIQRAASTIERVRMLGK
jgi:predicted ATP-binding protein involved in virulence